MPTHVRTQKMSGCPSVAALQHLANLGRRLSRPEGKEASAFIMALATVAARALLSAHGSNVERALRVLDS
jgi:hypothetical protein